MFTSGSIRDSQRMLVEIIKNGAIAKVKIWKKVIVPNIKGI